MTQGTIPGNVTRAACAFIEASSYDKVPAEAVQIARRCILDGLALFVAGSDEELVEVLVKDARDIGGRADALLLAAGDFKVPANLAARVLGRPATLMTGTIRKCRAIRRMSMDC